MMMHTKYLTLLLPVIMQCASSTSDTNHTIAKFEKLYGVVPRKLTPEKRGSKSSIDSSSDDEANTNGVDFHTILKDVGRHSNYKWATITRFIEKGDHYIKKTQDVRIRKIVAEKKKYMNKNREWEERICISLFYVDKEYKIREWWKHLEIIQDTPSSLTNHVQNEASNTTQARLQRITYPDGPLDKVRILIYSAQHGSQSITLDSLKLKQFLKKHTSETLVFDSRHDGLIVRAQCIKDGKLVHEFDNSIIPESSLERDERTKSTSILERLNRNTARHKEIEEKIACDHFEAIEICGRAVYLTRNTSGLFSPERIKLEGDNVKFEYYPDGNNSTYDWISIRGKQLILEDEDEHKNKIKKEWAIRIESDGTTGSTSMKSLYFKLNNSFTLPGESDVGQFETVVAGGPTRAYDAEKGYTFTSIQSSQQKYYFQPKGYPQKKIYITKCSITCDAVTLYEKDYPVPKILDISGIVNDRTYSIGMIKKTATIQVLNNGNHDMYTIKGTPRHEYIKLENLLRSKDNSIELDVEWTLPTTGGDYES